MADTRRSLATFARARWGLRFTTREDLLRWQQGRLAGFLRAQLPRASFYRRFTGGGLERLPVVDKATVLADFAAFNTHGITLDDAMGVATSAKRSRDFAPTIDGLTVGLSSGTSGTRGVFLVSADERARWAGLVLARLLTPRSLAQLLQPWRQPLGIAFFLRANSNLYETVASRRLRFQFHDLLDPLPTHVERLNAAQPNVLVAPPTVLRRLAEAALDGTLRIHPRQVVSVAEVIEGDDREAIMRTFGVPMQEVYQATEGFLAATCRLGRLHLNEEFVHIEPEWLDTDHRRFRPIVTDFTRTTQLVIRYRLDDVLRVSQERCACGRATRVIDAIEGRADDVLWSESVEDGQPRAVFPDTVRRAMALAGESIRDYRIEQRERVWMVRMLSTPGADARAEDEVTRDLAWLCRSVDVVPPVIVFAPWVDDGPLEKRRRIRCVSRPVERAVPA